MTTPTLNQRDHLIQEDVRDELAWAPEVNDAHVGVSVLDGVVTLSGEVDTYGERIAAKEAAQRVVGVTVVAEDLTVRAAARSDHTDTDIATTIKNILSWSADLPQGAVKVEVQDHVIVLSGVVPWNYQRLAAARLIRGTAGVYRIDNQIELTPRVSADGTAKLIKSALVRHALIDANAITVTTSGAEVTLTGAVHSWDEKSQAAHAAWSSPHVGAVHNEIEVRP